MQWSGSGYKPRAAGARGSAASDTPLLWYGPHLIAQYPMLDVGGHNI